MKGGTLSMVDKKNLGKVFQKHDFTNFEWIEPYQVMVSRMSMNAFSTVGKLGYPIEVLSYCEQTMNRYTFLFID